MSSVFGDGPKPLDRGSSDATITSFDRQVIESLRKVLLLPNEFKEYLVQYLTLNQPPIPAGQIPGLFRAVSRQYAASSAPVEIVSSTTETSVLSEILPGGILGTSGIAFVTLDGDYLSNDALNNVTFRIKFGGTTFVGNLTGTGVTNASRAPLGMTFRLINLGSAASNKVVGNFWIGDQAALSVAGIGGNTPPVDNFFASAPQTIDTTASQTLEVTLQNSVNGANTSVRVDSYDVSIIG